MPEDTEQGLSAKSEDAPKERLPDETERAADPAIERPKKTTEIMEVHKHPHHVMHKKKWGEYLLEFFMLFLAVFLGFIAENTREHTVEKEREKQYMLSLVADLSADTATINYGLPRKEGKIKALDSMFTFFYSHKHVSAIPGVLFRTLRRTTWDQPIDRNTITISQLKNAGNMRLVQKKKVADAISAYDMLWINLGIYRDTYTVYSQSSNQYAEMLVNPDDLLPLYIANKSQAIISNIPDSVVIRIDTSQLKQELNFMMGQKVSIYQQLDLYKHLRENAENLISLIKKEYDLE